MRIDTLDKYDELLAAGVKEQEARVIARAISTASEIDFNVIATKNDLNVAISGLEKDLKIFFVYLTGGAFLAALILPVVSHLVLKYMGLV